MKYNKKYKYDSSIRSLAIFFLPSLCVFLYVYMFVLSSMVILFFAVCGMASNTDEAISEVSLVIAFFIMIRTEYVILRRPVMRVKVLLMSKEELHGMTWGHVCILNSLASFRNQHWRNGDMLLDKLHWLPKDIIKRRFPIYVGLSATLFLISCGFGTRKIYFLILNKYFLH